jgi:hypothetical protein
VTFLEAVPRISERRLAEQIVEHAQLMGWRVFPNLEQPALVGRLPRSLVLVRRPRVLWLEVTAERRRLTADQRAWINDLADCGQEVHVVRPSQWREVERWLR